MTAEAQGVGKGQGNIGMHRGVRHAVQVAAFVLLVQMDRGRDHPFVQRKQAGQRLNGARGVSTMSFIGVPVPWALM